MAGNAGWACSGQQPTGRAMVQCVGPRPHCPPLVRNGRAAKASQPLQDPFRRILLPPRACRPKCTDSRTAGGCSPPPPPPPPPARTPGQSDESLASGSIARQFGSAVPRAHQRRPTAPAGPQLETRPRLRRAMAAQSMAMARCSGRVISSRQAAAPRRLPAAAPARRALVCSRSALTEVEAKLGASDGAARAQCARSGRPPRPAPALPPVAAAALLLEPRPPCRPARLPADSLRLQTLNRCRQG